MDNFFYNLNDKLNAIRATPETQLNESAVAEASYSAKAARAGKDIGKPGKNFEKIAKSAGKRYGSKAAGERVAGAVLNKLRHPKEGVEEGVVDWAKEKYHGFQTNRQLDKVSQAEKKGNTAAADAAHAAALKHRDLEQTARFNRTGSTMPKNSAQGYDQDAKNYQALKAKGLVKGMAEADMEEGNEFSGELAKAKAQHKDQFSVDGKTYPVKEEGGIPMTAKQKSFAALAPPKDKITFADKIAGAKQEVEEMLGDVAAEAMRNALGGRKQMADEGFDDMMSDVKKRMGPKVGDVKRGARHDIETTATGVRATRRYDDETDDQTTGEKRGRGRPKSSEGPRQERTTAKSRKTDRTAWSKKKTNEDDLEIIDRGEYDQEGEMAKDDIKTIVRHAQALEKILGDNDNLPEWVQAKLAKIEGMMTAVDDYMQNQKDQGDEMPVGEEKTTTRDNRAERAGKKVTKDIEYDEKKKDDIHGKRRGSEDAKAEKAGKKVAKDIEYDEKKKEKKVDETTSSGSVATGGAAPKAGKGGMQIGKGIYDSLNREVEGMIAESMSVNVSMTNDDSGSHKNITVTAADEDAEVLAQLLARAGLTGGGMQHDHGHEEPCPDCGSTDCGCDEAVEEAYGDTNATQNQPDWPTDTEYSDDALQYSGGLNKPKTDIAGDGQTTIPNTAVHTQDEDELRRLREMAGIKQQELKPWERTMKEAAVEEGVVDTVKDVVKKGIDALKGPDDDKLLSKLEKETGGKRPEKKDEKMQESLMREFANFRI